MTFNLFNVISGFTGAPKDKARNATDDETKAYLMARRERLGLPIINKLELHFAYLGSYRRGERGHCVGATFGSVTGKAWETGAYSILMPGYAVHRARVTMETLDEAGEVIASQTLPVEPKKGGVIWSRDDVRKAAGKVAKPSKRQNAPLSPSEPVAPAVVADEPETAPLASEAQPRGPATTDPTPTADVSAIFDRLEALEQRVAALSVEAGPTVAKRERSPAHERAVRRAWAERLKARKRLRNLRAAEESNHAEYRAWKQARAGLEKERDQARADAAAWQKSSEEYRCDVLVLGGQRDRATPRARRMLAAARRSAAEQRQRADVLQAQLVKIRADMADPHQPERASDVSQLRRERDEARTALSAVTARAERAEAAVQMLAPKIEEMASRVARAEAALRARAA